jgi:hypothetical protein
MQGHAMLWDPLFALWGFLLLGGLWLTRHRDGTSTGRQST